MEDNSASRAAYLASMERLRARIREQSAAESASPPPERGLPGQAGVGTGSGARLEAILEGLNEQQRAAVVHEGGPLLVVAGAGSGKTRVLTSRIAYLIASGRASPGQILAITFTNKAAREMRERLEAALGPLSRAMWISTFHSACLRILRAEHSELGMRSSFTIYDAADAQRLMAMVCREENIDSRAHPPKKLSRRVSDMKNDLVSPSDALAAAADRDEQVEAEAYAAYQQRLREANAMDFDDLIMATVQLLRSNPRLAEHYRRRFRHILVDEYQDTNHAQYALIRLLTGTAEDAVTSSLTVVGDADQSIYAFRGATIRNITDFEEDFPDATSILLEQNYRSTQSILSAANRVISHNRGRRPKRLWTDLGAGEKLVGYVADSEADESAFVVDEIDSLRQEHGHRYGDVAVFYRTNAQSRAVEDMFVRAGIPYRVIGGTRFYERREIKDALAYLHAVANPDDTVSIRRILNVPKRGLGAKAEEAVALHAARWSISFGAALADVAQEDPQRGPVEGLTARARATMTGFVQMLQRVRALAEEGEAPATIIDEILEDSGYLDALRSSTDPQDESRLENLAELHSVAHEFRAANPEGTLEEWLDQVSLVADSDQLAEGDEGEGEVTLMTVHTAKGLEFPVVFITGLEDGTFPHMRSLGEARELDEERRLAYVAITRARQRLYITRAATRSAWGAPQEFPPSRFIEEIGEGLVDWRREASSQDVLRSSGWYGPGSGRGGYARGGYSRGGSFEDSAFDGAPVLGSGRGFVPGKLGVGQGEAGRGGADHAGGSGRPGDAKSGADRAGGSESERAGEPGSPERTAGGESEGLIEHDGLAIGDMVRHKSFGTGKILAFEGRGRSTVAKVRFRTGQTKRLMLRFAPLEKM
ncbi:MAG: UvrD-helicase domain-containing protein [Actinomycetaceae bacterium]|nr:UvrD-helicase domain-containing protein [Actinomycetaceae bacterium]